MQRKVSHDLQREMPDVTLLGVHGWEPLANDHDVNGVLFSDGFYGGSNRPGTKQFVDAFQSVYGTSPGLLEAQAYDAGLIAQQAIAAGAHSRAEVIDHLHSLMPIDGATGQLIVTPQGVQRRMFLLQVYDGQLSEVGGTAG